MFQLPYLKILRLVQIHYSFLLFLYMINYMKNNPNKKFFVVTPFLSEIERIIKEAPFLKEPMGTGITKSQHLYHLICEGNNIITTHAMFCKLNFKMIELIEEAGYTLILDEVTNVLNSWNFNTSDDEKNFFAHYGYKDDDGDERSNNHIQRHQACNAAWNRGYSSSE